VRINVFISSKGVCSRREADRWIQSGKVQVNGKIALTGQNISEADVVMIDGRPLVSKPKIVYIAYHKPIGIECTTDQTKKANIIDAIGYPERIFPIGRLDKDSSGLILLTNDGQIVNKILRSENQHEKEYLVTVDQIITDDFIENMAKGVQIYNPVRHVTTITLPAKIFKIHDHMFRIIIVQGLNLQIRRMAESLENKVRTLQRIRILNINLGDLGIGKYRTLTKLETQELMQLIQYSPHK
jgi:23S rRNA pseudouridine2604 synthase